MIFTVYVNNQEKKLFDFKKNVLLTDAGMAMDLELSVTGSEPCHISHTLFCYVHNMDEPLHLHVDTDIKV